MKKYEQILSEIKNEGINKFIRKVMEVELPPEIHELAEDYEKMGGERPLFLWKWCWDLTYARKPGFMLSCVPESNRYSSALAKSILIFAVTVTDDISDVHKNKRLLDVMLKVPFEKIKIPADLVTQDQHRVKIEIESWRKTVEILSKAPRWEEFREMFMFDLKQTWNTFLYAYTANKNVKMLNYLETKIYGAHNMMFYLFADIDLMFSPEFDMSDLPLLREAVWKGQQMARIGNWLSTWEREMKETDFSSGVFGYAISEGIITPSELEESVSDPKIAEDIKQKIKKNEVEKNLLEEWEMHRNNILKLAPKVKSVDLREYVEGLELLLKYHLASTGKK